MSAEACCTLVAVPTSWAIGTEKLSSRPWKATSSPTLSVPATTCTAPTPSTAAVVRLDTSGGTRLVACWIDRAALLGVHRARVVAGPLGEEVALGAGGLQRLDGLQADDRDGVELAHLGLQAQHDVLQHALHQRQQRDVEGGPADGDGRQGGVVEQHDDAEERGGEAGRRCLAAVARQQPWRPGRWPPMRLARSPANAD